MDLFCYLFHVCLVCLFLAAVWSSAGKGLTSLLSCMLCFLVFLSLFNMVLYLIVLITVLILLFYLECAIFSYSSNEQHYIRKGGCLSWSIEPF